MTRACKHGSTTTSRNTPSRLSCLTEAQARVSKLIELTLTCETGRWILAAEVDAKNELAISRVEAGEVKNYVIDRTFLDDREEVRWVIDYKTSEPLDGESTADFNFPGI